MTRKEILHALKPLIRFKKQRLAVGFWNDGAPGLEVIDKTLKAFDADVEFEAALWTGSHLGGSGRIAGRR